MRPHLCPLRSARLIASLGAGLIATIIAAGLFGSAATAQDSYGDVFGYQSQQLYKRQTLHRRSRGLSPRDRGADHAAGKGKEEAKKSAPQGSVYAVVSLADQHVTVYDSTGRIAQSPISSGMPGHPSPIGLFSIIGKERWHRSNIYSGAPMPFMQRITWSGVAMHLGVVPGYPASHGCIRLPDGFAEQFWGMTQIGSRIVVARRDAIPVEIASTVLPVPKLRPAPESLPDGQQSSLSAPKPLQLASISEAPPMSATAPEQTQARPATAPPLLNPIAYAKTLKELALSSKATADKIAKDALPAAQTAGAKAQQAMDDVTKAETTLRAAETKFAARIAPNPASPSTPGAKGADAVAAAPGATAEAAQREIDRARAAVAQAQSREVIARQVAFAANQTWKDAVAAGERAADSIKEAERRLKPASILFSKKEGRVFIRQDWKEVYDAPITFKEPDRSIGTHLFIAVNGDADGKVKWSAISVPSAAAPRDDARYKRAKNGLGADPAPGPQGDTASEALARLELADHVRERIAELVWIGAQVIITDNARSDEMDDDSDIIVSTR